MSHLILVRHGQSEWNLQKKFTGWVDVELTPNGKLEACKSGELIKPSEDNKRKANIWLDDSAKKSADICGCFEISL